MRTYLDSAPVIYHVQRIEEYWRLVEQRLDQSELRPVVSDLTRMECRVKPIRESNDQLLRNFDAFFSNTESVPLTSEVFDLATTIQARYRYTTPDALHLAAAIASECDIFLTNDRRLSSFPEIRVELIDSYV